LWKTPGWVSGHTYGRLDADRATHRDKLRELKRSHAEAFGEELRKTQEKEDARSKAQRNLDAAHGVIEQLNARILALEQAAQPDDESEEFDEDESEETDEENDGDDGGGVVAFNADWRARWRRLLAHKIKKDRLKNSSSKTTGPQDR